METELDKILQKLKSELPYKWKPQWQNKEKTKRQCVAYIDSRDVQNILDNTCIWQNEFYEVKWKLFCKIWIFTKDYWLLWRSDSWFLENDNIEDWTESKWEVSDTFKRAWVLWGIWRFLYSKKIQWITNEEFNENKYKLTEFIENKQKWNTQVTATNSPVYVMTQKDVDMWNWKIYWKKVYLNEETKIISDEQIKKLMALPKFIPNK